MSSHRKETKALSKQIEDIESKMIDRKPWHLSGEVSSRQRPKNSLLEAEIEFEQPTKVCAAPSNRDSCAVVLIEIVCVL